MFKLLTYHKGSRYANELDDEFAEDEVNDEDLIRCFNEARDVAIKHYLNTIKECPGNDYSDGEVEDASGFDVLETMSKDAEIIE